MKRGIFLVANLNSQDMCKNLIYSIRSSGCTLPIRLIHFGGKKINSPYILGQVEFLSYEDFPEEARKFVVNLRSVLTDCPMGFLYRFLGFFSDWDEFLYADNDIVALTNWECMFEYLDGFDLVHADEEYTTKGAFNYYKPELVRNYLGPTALETAFTAGHIIIKRNSKLLNDINAAVEWYRMNPGIAQKHDQALLHIASLIGNWKIRNLCKPPYNWLSSWAGDFITPLKLIQTLQNKHTRISHIHYSGGIPDGNRAIDEFLFAGETDRQRIKKLMFIGIRYWTGYTMISKQLARTKRSIKRRLNSFLGLLS